MMDGLQSQSPNKLYRSAATDPVPSQRGRLTMKTKILGDLAGTCALSQSPSKSSFNYNPPVASSNTASLQFGKNAEAGPFTKSNAVSQRRDLITPTRVSSRVSRPTMKKKASSFEVKYRSLESDSTPPHSIISPALTLSQSPSKSSFNISPVTSSNTASIPSGKNAKAGPSTKSIVVSRRHDPITPTRVSSRVSHPTLKKKASSSKRKSRSPESDGTSPLSITSSAPLPSLKRKRPTNGSIKRLTGNNTPYKRKWVDPNPIELTSDDDGSRAQPPQKRAKHTPKKLLSPEVIDLCSESEDVISLPKRRHTRHKGSAVVVLSTDEEVDYELPSFSRLALRETDTKESPALPPLGDIPPPIKDESVLRASSSPQTHSTPAPIPNVLVAEEDGATDESNAYTEKVDFPRGSLQTLYNEALARCVREPQHAKEIIDQPSPFSPLKRVPPTRIIRYSTHSRSLTLHTPLFFNRIIRRLRARLKLRKTLDAKSFSDDTYFVATESSKLNEEQEDTSDIVMGLSTVDSEAPEAANRMTIVPSTDFQDDALSDAQAARIPPITLANDLDVNQRHVSKTPSTPSPLANQDSSFPPDVVMLEDTPIPENIQALEVSADSRTTSSGGVNLSADLPNMPCMVPSNPTNSNAVNYQIETPQEAETILFRKENHVDQVATIEPSVLKAAQFLVQALRQRYDAPKISESSLLPAMEFNNTVKSSAAVESHSESPGRSKEHATTTNISYLTISSLENTSSDFKCLSESPMIPTDHATLRNISPHATSGGSALLTSESSDTPMIILVGQATTLNLSSPTCSSAEDASSSAEHVFKSPATLTEHATMLILPSSTASQSNADTLILGNSPPSTHSRQSSDHSTSVEPVNCRLVTPEDSPSPLTPPVEAQKQEPFIRSGSSPPIVASSLDMDSSELGLRTLMDNKFDKDDDDDDDISLSGMELVYPEEIT